MSGCGGADFVDANIFALLELGKGLDATGNAACRTAFLTQAQAFVGAAGNTDGAVTASVLRVSPGHSAPSSDATRARAVCSNGVLYMGGAVENYGVCPTTGAAFAGACPADCTALLGSMPSWCASTDVVRLPQLALQYKGLACTQPVCAVGTASMAVGAAQAQLQLPPACLPAGATGTRSSPGARAGAAPALAAAALAVLALA